MVIQLLELTIECYPREVTNAIPLSFTATYLKQKENYTRY